jgi:hypothetical protein
MLKDVLVGMLQIRQLRRNGFNVYGFGGQQKHGCKGKLTTNEADLQKIKDRQALQGSPAVLYILSLRPAH